MSDFQLAVAFYSKERQPAVSDAQLLNQIENILAKTFRNLQVPVSCPGRCQ